MTGPIQLYGNNDDTTYDENICIMSIFLLLCRNQCLIHLYAGEG